MREIFNLIELWKRRRKKTKKKRSKEVSKIFNFGNLKREISIDNISAVRTREEAFLPAYKLGYDFK